MKSFEFKGVMTDCMDVDANPELGFNFPFKIVIPKNVGENTEVVYASPLPRNESDKCNSFEEMIECAKKDLAFIDPMHEYLCLEKGYPMIIPVIPRTKDFRPNFLGEDCFKNDFSKCTDFKFKDEICKYDNLALQHKRMIEYAIKCLRDNNINVDDRVILCGYSEGSKFASHLAILHPEVVKAVVAGGTGGVMSMPVCTLGEYKCTYPVGIANVENFNQDAFEDIAFFYYMGSEDKSDSAMPDFDPVQEIDENGNVHFLVDECGNLTPPVDENGKQLFKLDENGNYRAKFPMFSDEHVNILNKVLGTVNQDRFKKQKEIYDSLGLNSTFKLYPGNHRTIFDNSKEIFQDVDKFIADNLVPDIKKEK